MSQPPHGDPEPPLPPTHQPYGQPAPPAGSSSGPSSSPGPYQPYQAPPPYAPHPYAPNPYAAQPRSNTTRNVLLIVATVVVLVCGGLVAGTVALVSRAGDAIDSAFDDEYVGSEDDPLSVDPGEAFSIRGVDYDSGWSVGPDDTGRLNVQGLRGTNDRDDGGSVSANLVFTFLSGTEVVGEVRCSSGVTIPHERSRTFECYSGDVTGTDYEIEVHDSALFE